MIISTRTREIIVLVVGGRSYAPVEEEKRGGGRSYFPVVKRGGKEREEEGKGEWSNIQEEGHSLQWKREEEEELSLEIGPSIIPGIPSLHPHSFTSTSISPFLALIPNSSRSMPPY